MNAGRSKRVWNAVGFLKQLLDPVTDTFNFSTSRSGKLHHKNLCARGSCSNGLNLLPNTRNLWCCPEKSATRFPSFEHCFEITVDLWLIWHPLYVRIPPPSGRTKCMSKVASGRVASDTNVIDLEYLLVAWPVEGNAIHAQPFCHVFVRITLWRSRCFRY